MTYINGHTYIFPGLSIKEIGIAFVLKHAGVPVETETKGYYALFPDKIAINLASFARSALLSSTVSIKKDEGALSITCGCDFSGNRLCEHQSRVLLNIARRDELRIFFDEILRRNVLLDHAKAYGLENEPDPDEHFTISLTGNELLINPIKAGLLPVSVASLGKLKLELGGDEGNTTKSPPQGGKKQTKPENGQRVTILIMKQHRHYKHFQAEIAEATLTPGGKVKGSLILLDPLDLIWQNQNPSELKFYSAVAKFRTGYEERDDDSIVPALQALIENPLGLPVFSHDPAKSETVTAASLLSVQLENLKTDVELLVECCGDYYEISGKLLLDDVSYELSALPVRFNYFLLRHSRLILISNPAFLRLVDFFRRHTSIVSVRREKFEEFRIEVLAGLETHVRINYTFLRDATEAQLEEIGADTAPSKIIYLSESGTEIWITPVMRYGAIEVAVGSMKQVYAIDGSGNSFRVRRDEEAETRFLSSVIRSHPFFAAQLGNQFSLHKNRFLDENWFLNVFDDWHREGITVLGFSSLTKNKLNPNKAAINIRVMSGLDWFETSVQVYYGKAKVPLSKLQKSVQNKNRFIRLDDGTLGILPQEWLDKFDRFFSAGEVVDDIIQTPKNNFAGIIEMYDRRLLDTEVKLELRALKSRLAAFKTITAVNTPALLNATLRDYQKEGLSWLNFLDEFNFGGCLADDMGLGKTIQVIAFLLLQEEKHPGSTTLIVVPTTLISNWEKELTRFAPSLTLTVLYGSNRVQKRVAPGNFNVIITSYGTLLNEISFLKDHRFNYIVLDESQAIKNPDSLRYKSVRLLQSRNKLVLTGTPIENNTFDLYGQLSFACPGLLGSKQYFREIYAIPIDQFKDKRRARELRKKIAPFILRRTKQEVAPELPEKTEMTIYCEMAPAQKEIYDSYKREYREYLLSHEEDEIPKHAMHILKGITILRQICDSPALLNEGAYYGESSAKIRVLMEEIETKSPDHKILVFSQFVTMLDLIRKELETRKIPFEYLTGQTRKRGDKADAFQSDKSIRVFLISLKAGGTGLNLTGADYVYLVDPWWNPAVENQAIDRAHRIGQDKHVVAVRLICPGTIEEKMLKIQESKKGLVKNLVQTNGTGLKGLTKANLEDFFT